MDTSILTRSGLHFDPFEETPHFDIEDIADQLAGEMRFANCSEFPYTVAQHCVLASQYVDKREDFRTGDSDTVDIIELAALLHDAAEAYLRDVPGPFKHALPDYRKLERKVLEDIYKECGVPLSLVDDPRIKAIDKELCDAERAVLFPWSYEEFTYDGDILVEPWCKEYARFEFLNRYKELDYVLTNRFATPG